MHVANVAPDLDRLCEQLRAIRPQARPCTEPILKTLSVPDPEASVRKTTSHLSQTTPFVGRQRERQILDGCFGDSREEGIMIFLDGESGMGKSELATHFIKEAHVHKPHVVSFLGRCYERESIPYKAFDDIANELSRYWIRLNEFEATQLLPRRAHLLARLFPVLDRLSAVSGAPRQENSCTDPVSKVSFINTQSL